MRANVIGLIALPVAAGGIATLVAVMAFGSTEPPPSPPGQTATAGIAGEATDETALADAGEENNPDPGSTGQGAVDDGVAGEGTAIEGSKPYLTVIDGLATLPVPAPLPAVLAGLTAPSVSLAPLPPAPGGGSTERSRGRIGTTTWLQDPPLSPGSESGRGRALPAPESHSDSPRPWGGGGTGGGADRGDDLQDGVSGGPAAPAPDSGRPPQADETGRPPNAGAPAPGRPPAVGAPAPGRPPAVGAPAPGRPPAIDPPAVELPTIDPPAVELPAIDPPAVDPVESSPAGPADTDVHPSDDQPTTR